MTRFARPPTVRHVVVGIPARDEATSIGPCLVSVMAAAAVAGVPVHVSVADDGSVDDTATRAWAFLSRARHVTAEVFPGRFGTAGAARGSALDAGLAAIGADPATVWLASTDADSVVARNWITTHVAWADAGLDAVAGLVDVAWEDDQRLLARRFAAARTAAGTGIGHRHVHGANLGVRGDRWVEVGGCGAGDDGEDGELWRRLHAAGIATLGVTDLRVRTSGRLHGRASRGFNGYLRALDADAQAYETQQDDPTRGEAPSS